MPAPTTIESELADDPELAELIGRFVERLPRRVGELQNALDAQDLEGVATLAHRLKGAAGNYGFTPVWDAAKQLEESAKTAHQLADVQTQVEALVDLCGRVRAPITS
jgi:HPt (histidine-containing phosphotransfer) domain-containing protein